MSDFLPDPLRWKDQRDQSSSAEREVGRAFRSLQAPKPLSPAQVARIAERVRSRPSNSFPWRLWLTTAAALLLGGATAASAAHLNLLPRWLAKGPPPVAKHAAQAQPRRLKSAIVKPPPAEEPSMPGLSEDPVPVEQAKPAQEQEPLRRAAPSPRSGANDRAPPPMHRPATSARITEHPGSEMPRAPSADSSSSPGPLSAPSFLVPGPVASPQERPPGRRIASAEDLPAPAAVLPPRPKTSGLPAATDHNEGAAGHLAEAIRQLRVEHAPKTALETLDRHEAELGQSGLAHELLLVRVEALLLLHREKEVLRLLDGASLKDVAAQRSLLLTRGELRAAAGRCAEALGDFELVLARSNPPDQRALRGRAACTGLPGEGPDRPQRPGP